MADDPRRARNLVDPRATPINDLRSQNIRLFRFSRQGTKRNNVGLAIQKNFLDVILQVRVLDFPFAPLESWVHLACHVAHANNSLQELRVRMRSLARHRNMMSLHVENESMLLVFSNRCRLQKFRSIDSKERSKDGIHGRESQCHTTGAAQKLTSIHTQVFRCQFSICHDLVLQTALLNCLWDRLIFFVRDHLGRDRQVAVKPCIELRLTNPTIVNLGLRTGSLSFWVPHRSLRDSKLFLARILWLAPDRKAPLANFPAPVQTNLSSYGRSLDIA